MTVELNDALFAKLAGWEAMKQARDFVATGAVLRSEWQPPRLHGLVREGNTSYPAGLLIRSATDADNACPCRTSRQRGLICAHSVAVGLHYLASLRPQTPPPSTPTAKPPLHRPAVSPSNRAPAPSQRFRARAKAATGPAWRGWRGPRTVPHPATQSLPRPSPEDRSCFS